MSNQSNGAGSVSEEFADRPGIQSVEVAAALLRALTELGASAKLKDLAAAADMAPAKAHRYLVSLTRSGLVTQEEVSGRYAIGPLSLAMGLAALGSIDVVRVATAAMPDLRDRIDETVVLAVWGSHGPTVVRFEESSQPVTINVRVGNILPLESTALGRIFAAYQPVARIAEQLGAAADGTAGVLAAITAEVRDHGLARVAGNLLPGVSGMAAPVFDHQGRLAAALGAIGRQAAFDTNWDGKPAREIRAAAAMISERLGYRN